ncbi:MAG: S1C family serine protease [Magnetovibrio sp.]|nr:S1C family serine protease [Magnetovibrio sp.]
MLAVLVCAPAAAEKLTFGDIAGAVVQVHSEIKEGARTARSLGLERAGNGVVIDKDGLILTIGYLIMESKSVSVVTQAGRKVPARFVAYDHPTGFGLIRADSSLGIRPIALGESASVVAGTPLLALSAAGQQPFTPVRAVSRRTFAGYWEYLLDSAIFTMPVHGQYGGAALVDLQGNLVGIGSLFINDALEPGQPAPGNMFVPIDLLKPILDRLIHSGRSGQPARPWLGVYTAEAEGRIIVNRVATGGPGETAGMKPGDIIVGIGGRRVANMADLFRKVWSTGKAGVDVSLDVLPMNAGNLDIKKVVIHSRDRRQWLRLDEK